MTSVEFRKIQKTIPDNPGIYKYFDAGNELIYVGKARSLRKRVSSYFTKTFTGYKTHELVKRISKIEFVIVGSEQDALLLENSLIKEFQPKYNISLKDDKSYPYIVIKKEPFPRIFFTRRLIKDGSEYLGPFTSVKKVRELVEFIRNTIPLRTCSLNLSKTNIEKGKFKVCLEYHLGNCKGPCEGLQDVDNYNENLKQVRNILKGNLSEVVNYFKREIKSAVENLAYEKAAILKKKIEFLENYQASSVVVNPRFGNADVFSIVKENQIAYINYLMVRSGTIVQSHTIRAEAKLEETEQEILELCIQNMRTTFNSDAKEIIVPVIITPCQPDVMITVPRSGDKKKLLDLSFKNAGYYIEEIKNKDRLKLGIKNSTSFETLEQLQKDLQLSSLPVHIECFDNSNFQGSYPVSAMVCFKNGEPSKADYRHFNIKTVVGINDFASMKETVFRRYKRLTEEGKDYPQLVIIDGGKGQLSSASEAIRELGLEGKMTLVGLAKNEEEIFFTGDRDSLKLPFNSQSLKFIRKIRDEVHRFGITFHRKKRSAGTFKNELEDIRGIGKATADMLLKEFKSIKNIRNKTIEELALVIGHSKASTVLGYFRDKS
ncbi:MAG: excinuclease ABC subunit C [Bacteroidetes bacterium]|nr:MAG: excinuclease ABC subunit C [Bacteroidota bacterium]